MGWYHAVQLIEGRVPHGKLVAVVEVRDLLELRAKLGNDRDG
jgi:hypothetical protein